MDFIRWWKRHLLTNDPDRHQDRGSYRSRSFNLSHLLGLGLDTHVFMDDANPPSLAMVMVSLYSSLNP